MKIKAIETEYNGYKFRSRLEARWAVFFDCLDIKYKYEEYGFECDEGRYKWLPDFYLPEYCTWVEVKGGQPTASDAEKMAFLLDYGSPLPFFHCSDQPVWTDADRDMFIEMGGPEIRARWLHNKRPGVLLLGDIPRLDFGVVLHPFVTHHKGLIKSFIQFKNGGFEWKTGEEVRMFSLFSGIEYSGPEYIDSYGSTTREQIDFFSPDALVCESLRSFRKAMEAYKIARQSRFEHGQTPKVGSL